MLAARGQPLSCPSLHPRIPARPGEPKWAALLRKMREDRSFVPRIVLIDSFANLRLGGGNRWTKRGGSSMYAPAGNHTFVAAAKTVAATLSRNINTILSPHRCYRADGLGCRRHRLGAGANKDA